MKHGIRWRVARLVRHGISLRNAVVAHILQKNGSRRMDGPRHGQHHACLQCRL